MFLSNNSPINRIGLPIVLAAWITLIIVTGCQTNVSEIDSEDNPTVVIEVTPTVSSPQTYTTQPNSTVTPTATPEDNLITLTFWTVEPVSPESEGETGDFISNSLRTFERTNSNLEVELVIKKSSGKGGILDFLRTTKEVAPSVLPDVAIINSTDVEQAYNEGLIQPLDGRLDRSIVQDLLPAARRMSTVNDRLAGVPLGLEMEHVIYNTRVFTATPVLWTDILSHNTQYLFPAKGVNGLVNAATLSQYFSAGGEFFDDRGEPKIDEQILRDVLIFYQQAVENNIISTELLEASTTEDLWPIYLEARAGIAHISVRQYLTDRELLNNSNFTSIPVQNEKDIPVSITQSWALVLVTNDVGRQKAALSLIEWFLTTSNNAAWNNINKSIPTRDTAYQQLAGDDPYWVFLTEQLNTARPQPSFAGYDRIGRIIQQAVEQVIQGEATPDEATATAIDALTQ